nr:unnamed protein product [Callosobruchus analis]
MSRYSTSFEKLFALFGVSMLTRVHVRVLFGKGPRNNYNAKQSNSKLQITANTANCRN